MRLKRFRGRYRPCACGCGQMSPGDFARGHNMRTGGQAQKNGEVTAKSLRVPVPEWFHELSDDALVEAAAVRFIEVYHPGMGYDNKASDGPTPDAILEVAAKGDLRRWLDLVKRMEARIKELRPDGIEPKRESPFVTCSDCGKAFEQVTLRRGLCAACWKREYRAKKRREAA